MLNNKKTIIFLIISFIIASVFYFILPESGDNQKEDVWENLCYLKKDENKTRLIKVYNTKIVQFNKELIRGEDIFKTNLETVEKYNFAGFKDKDILSVFGDEDGVQTERIYKINNDGIIEAYVKDGGRQVLEKNGIKFSNIIERKKVTFDEGYLIPKVDCNTLEK